MTKTIFRNTFLVGLLVLALCGLLFFGIQYRQAMDDGRDALKIETGYVMTGLETSGREYLEGVKEDVRITWIAADGKVLYDNEYSLPLDNQLDQKEVAAALKDGEGSATRKSDKGHSAIYYARRCSDGSVIRLGRSGSAVLEAFILVSPVLWILVLVVLISGILAFKTAKQIVEPINNLDFDHPENSPYQELMPMLDKIAEQKLTIQEETSKREEMRREFSANMSDELKTPLASIAEYARLISGAENDPAQVKELSGDISRETGHLMALVDDILKISRLDEEESLPKKEDVDLKNLAIDVAEAIRPVASKNSISVDVTGEGGTVSGDFSLLYEMLYNLCDNAVKYNYPGGSVTVDVTPSENDIKLSVKDTGIGIPKEHQARVFERFYRVDKSHSKEVGGTGLGLSIVKHGAAFHGAEVSLESTEGVGTTVTLSFPKAGK